MIRSFLLTIVLFTLIVFLSFGTAGNDTTVVQHNLVLIDDYEDYGCIHESHSQFDDGDGINIDILNSYLLLETN